MKKVKKLEEAKKNNRRHLKVNHNWKLFWLIIVLLVVLVLLIFYIGKLKKDFSVEGEKECVSDDECIPKECCHPGSCVKIEDANICEGIVCSAVCSGPLDCGVGHCGCIEGKCQIIED